MKETASSRPGRTAAPTPARFAIPLAFLLALAAGGQARAHPPPSDGHEARPLPAAATMPRIASKSLAGPMDPGNESGSGSGTATAGPPATSGPAQVPPPLGSLFRGSLNIVKMRHARDRRAALARETRPRLDFSLDLAAPAETAAPSPPAASPLVADPPVANPPVANPPDANPPDANLAVARRPASAPRSLATPAQAHGRAPAPAPGPAPDPIPGGEPPARGVAKPAAHASALSEIALAEVAPPEVGDFRGALSLMTQPDRRSAIRTLGQDTALFGAGASRDGLLEAVGVRTYEGQGEQEIALNGPFLLEWWSAGGAFDIAVETAPSAEALETSASGGGTPETLTPETLAAGPLPATPARAEPIPGLNQVLREAEAAGSAFRARQEGIGRGRIVRSQPGEYRVQISDDAIWQVRIVELR